MKNAKNICIIAVFLLLAVINMGANMLTENAREIKVVTSTLYVAGFTASLILTRGSKACNLFYMSCSFVIVAAILFSFIPTAGEMLTAIKNLVISIVLLPLSGFMSFLWIDLNMSFLGAFAAILLPFIWIALSIRFYTQNYCK